VRRLKNLYQLELSKSQGNSSNNSTLEEVPTLPRKKSGRPLLIGDELDVQVQEYIKHLRKAGSPVNTQIVIATAEGIILSKDANLLGNTELSKGWAKYLLKRIGFVKRKATTAAKGNVENFDILKEEFLLEIKNVVCMDEIPKDLIINFDQTGINYVPLTSWMMEQEGAKRVEIVAKDDKWQITAVFAASFTGDFLPPQLVYQGKTERCLPQFQFPPDWNITFSPNHWSNELTMKEYLEQIILPYINKKHEDLKFVKNYPALLIFDNFKAQCTKDLLHF